ncbi:MAG TPA: HEPN domain-containing protein [Verrucomicrobiae bacterium]|nr:HEPN domain-containing protein [Verrucomicrobiae bacterium]
MKASTREWIAKAEEDFAVALMLARPRKRPLWAPLCFHAQQCVEKYLKARLNEASVLFHKTHDLERLLNQTVALEPLWGAFSAAVKRLGDAAVLPRYPGGSFTKAEAQRAFRTCKAFRKEARQRLGLPVTK